VSSVDELARTIAQVQQRLRDLERKPQLADSSIEDGGINEYDIDGRIGSRLGQQFDGTHAAISLSGPKPPTPTAATVTPVLGGLKIHFDGTFAGAIAPMDYARVEAQASTDPTFPATSAVTLRGTFESPRGGDITVSLPPVPHYVRLVCRSLSGGFSTPSAAVAGTPIAFGDLLSDGRPPAASPTPTLTGGIGTLFVVWPAEANTDQVTYDVHLSAVLAFVAVPATRAVTTTGTQAVLRTLPDTTPLVNGVTYGVRVVARDRDGVAPPGPVVTGQMALLNTPDIAPGAIDAPQLADFILTARKFRTQQHLLY
jgi:hypothetical protein